MSVTGQALGPFWLRSGWDAERAEKPLLRGMGCGSGRPGLVWCPRHEPDLAFSALREGTGTRSGSLASLEERGSVHRSCERRDPYPGSGTGQPRPACWVGS